MGVKCGNSAWPCSILPTLGRRAVSTREGRLGVYEPWRLKSSCSSSGLLPLDGCRKEGMSRAVIVFQWVNENSRGGGGVVPQQWQSKRAACGDEMS